MMIGVRGTPRASNKEGARPEGRQGAESWVVTEQALKEERRLGKRWEGAWGQEVGSEDGREAAGKGGRGGLPPSLEIACTCGTSRLAAECQSPPLLSSRSPWGLHPLMAI